MITKKLIIALGVSLTLWACSNNEEAAPAAEGDAAQTEAGPGQSAVQDEVSTPNILAVAVGSPDHTTLVAAVQAADLVDALANAGPFTVFAPTNEAFGLLPEGTVETLVKPENKETLKQILLGHVMTSAIAVDYMADGKTYAMVDEKFTKWVITRKGDDVFIGDAKILGSVKASNGYVHVIDKVLLAK